jgi:hypothetical protein
LFLIFFILVQLVLNFPSSSFSLLNVRITGVKPYAWPEQRTAGSIHLPTSSPGHSPAGTGCGCHSTNAPCLAHLPNPPLGFYIQGEQTKSLTDRAFTARGSLVGRPGRWLL